VSNDTIGADENSTPVTDIAGQTVTPGTATTITGTYGTLEVDADGSYTYTLDNTNLAVQDLTSGESQTETFAYTIQDYDGDPITKDLVITVNGADDDATLNVMDGSVNEAGLDSTGSQAASDSEKLTGQQLTLTALDGLKEIEIAGTVISANDLENLTGPAAGAISTG
jgi:VCBS repeat-containing protein